MDIVLAFDPEGSPLDVEDQVAAGFEVLSLPGWFAGDGNFDNSSAGEFFLFSFGEPLIQ